MYLQNKKTGLVDSWLKRSLSQSLGEGDVAVTITNFVSNYWIILLPISVIVLWQIGSRGKRQVKSIAGGITGIPGKIKGRIGEFKAGRADKKASALEKTASSYRQKAKQARGGKDIGAAIREHHLKKGGSVEPRYMED